MMFKIVFAVLFVLVTGCSTVPKGYKLSEFSFNGKLKNSRIVSRIPDYGDGHADGCIIMKEMSLELTDSGPDVLKGIVKDVSSREAISSANITVSFANDTSQLKIASDSFGAFKVSQGVEISYISINSLGYRSLIVKISGRRQPQ